MSDNEKDDIIVSESTGNVYQYNNCKTGYIPEEEQLLFEFSDSNQTFVIGLISMLQCIGFAIEHGELPGLPVSWVVDVCDRYNIDYNDLCKE